MRGPAGEWAGRRTGAGATLRCRDRASAHAAATFGTAKGRGTGDGAPAGHRGPAAFGLTSQEIRTALATLPSARTPTKADWSHLSRAWKPRLDEQIATLERLRDRLTSCIGCGCLSFEACALYNPSDAAARHGAGPRYLLGDAPPTGRADRTGLG